MKKYIALVPAAGTGSRMGGSIPKQYGLLAGEPMIRHALRALCGFDAIDRVYVVIAPEDAWWEAFDWSEFAPRLEVVRAGGETRALSVINGLKAIAASPDDWVMVHDAARPCLDREALSRLVSGIGEGDVGGLLALPVADTLKRDGGSGLVVETVPRAGLWQAQTPQMFRYGLLLEALSRAPRDQTDEAGAVEALGLAPRLVEGSPANFKVTYPRDVAFAELILASRQD